MFFVKFVCLITCVSRTLFLGASSLVWAKKVPTISSQRSGDIIILSSEFGIN